MIELIKTTFLLTIGFYIGYKYSIDYFNHFKTKKTFSKLN